MDLTGDGHADILITEEDIHTFYPSLGRRRVLMKQSGCVPPRDEEEGAALIFADGTQSIYLADMSGDGLSDLVRIRNGESLLLA